MNREERISIYDECGRCTHLERLANAAASYTRSRGFWGVDADILSEWGRERMAATLMLVVTEVAEACEALRLRDEPGFAEELADTIIRILDIAGQLHLPIDQIIADKMRHNEDRPMKHGKDF